MRRKNSVNAWQLLLLGVMVQFAFAGDQKVNVLILSGSNNHNWQQTTPVIRNILTDAKISVEVAEKPARLTSKELSKYDVIVSNWNNWNNKSLDWSDKSKQAFLDFVRKGGGHVTVHSGGCSFVDWDQYHEIAAWWGPETGHGAYHAFPMNAVDTAHPICSGLNPIISTWTSDELWHKTEFPSESKTLMTAFSSSNFGGDNGFGPVLSVCDFGDGRCVNFMLGHNAAAMQQTAFKLLLTRSVQWAAGKNKLAAVPEDLPRTQVALYTNGLTIDEVLDANIKTIAGGDKQQAAQALKRSVNLLTAVRGYQISNYPDKFIELTKTVKTEQGQRSLLSIAPGFASEDVLAWTMVCFEQPQLKKQAASAALEIMESNTSINHKKKKKALHQIVTANLTEDLTSRAIMQMYMLTASKNLAAGALADSPDDLNDDGDSKGDQAAIDGNVDTYWDEQDGEQLYRLRIKLPQPETVGAIRITGHGHHSYSPKDFTVLLDGRIVKSITNAQYVESILLVQLPQTKCSVIELKITGYYGRSPAIRELAIYPPIEGQNINTQAKSIDEDELVISSGDLPQLIYRFRSVVAKPYVKFLTSPSGVNVLRDAPHDHLHHHALMFALRVNGIDYWSENSTTGKQIHKSFQDFDRSVKDNTPVTTFTSIIDWVDPSSKVTLKEKRVLSLEQSKDVTLLTWNTKLKTSTGIQHVKIGGDHYFGLGMRFLQSMDKNGTFMNSSGTEGKIFRGTERLTQANWCAYHAKADGKPVTVAMFDHPDNFRPVTWFTMLEPFSYLSATLKYHENPFTLKSENDLSLTYRVAVWDGKPEKAMIEQAYQDWLKQ